MKKMKPTIFKRLVIGNMIMIGFVVFLGAYVVYKLDELQSLSREIVDTDTKSLKLCENLSVSLSSLIMFEKKYIISEDVDYYNKYIELKTVFEEEIELLDDMVKTLEVKRLVQETQRLFLDYSYLFAEEMELIQNPPKEYDPSISLAERSSVAQSIRDKLKQIIVIKNELKTSKLLLSNSMIGKATELTLMITIIAIVLGILISVTNTKAITGSIFLLEKKTREISKGQFNHIPTIAAAPKEIEDLTLHFNVMCSRLKELEIMKTDFISHFSHELRTPITSIKSASSMLNMQLFKSDPHKEKELSQLIIIECDRLIKSIERILDLSKMEVFKMEYEFSETNIVKIIGKALARFIPAAQNKKIELKFLPAKDIPKTLLDGKRIEEVMNNLISNALKYTPEKGNILIKTELNKNIEKIIVSVSDNGCGIDKKNLERIFEKFKRIDKGNKILRGTGLGLAISKYIIKAHKGTIWAESEISKGTKIFFVIPVV
jgi:signal transduction histidine kinase